MSTFNIFNQIQLAPVHNHMATIVLSFPPEPSKADSQARNVRCGHIFWARIKGETKCTIVFGNVVLSRDGEARSLVMSRSNFDSLMSEDYWNVAEEAFVQYIAHANLDIYFCHPPTARAQENTIFERLVQRERYDYKIALAHFLHTIEAHIGRKSQTTINLSTWLDADMSRLLDVRNAITSAYGKNMLATSIRRIIQSAHFIVKIIPLTQNELRHYNDIRYRVWREKYAQDMCNLFRSELVCPNVTIYAAPGMLVHNLDENNFTNPYIVRRVLRSDILGEVTEVIARANARNVQALPTSNIAAATADLAVQDELDVCLKYAADNLAMSGSAIVFFSYFGTIPSDSPISADDITDVVFGWLAGLLAIHLHMGALHADAHAGNLRIAESGRAMDFVIGTRCYTTRAQHHGILIDFSRIIVNPHHPRILQHTTSTPDVLAQEQGRALFNFFLLNYPSRDDNRAVEELIHTEYDRAFRILSLLDPIFMLRSVRGMENFKARVDLLDRVLVLCENELTRALAAPMDYDITRDPLQDIIVKTFDMCEDANIIANPRSYTIMRKITDADVQTLGDDDAAELSMIINKLS